MRRLLRRLGVPPGAGIVLSTGTRRRLGVTVLGTLLMAGLDMLGVAALVPLVQLLTTTDREGSAIGRVADLVGGDPSDQELALIVGCSMIVAFTLKGTLGIAFRWWQVNFIAGEYQATATRVLRAYMAAPYRLHLSRSQADLFRVVGEAPAGVYHNVVMGTVSLITEVVTLTGLVLVLVLVNPLVALGALVYFGGVALLVNQLVRSRSRRAGEERLENSMRAMQGMIHSIGGVKESTLRRNGEYFVRSFDEANGANSRLMSKQAFLSELPKHLLEMTFVIGIAVMALLVFSSRRGIESLPTLAVFVAVGARSVPSLVRILAAATAVRFGLPSLRLLVTELQTWPSPPSLDVGDDRPGPRGDLAVRDLTFRYEGFDEDVIKGIAFTVPRGTSLAIVGPSGGGKTTLVDLLLGLHEPRSGAITVAGQDIRDNLPGWQRSIGMVPQDVFWITDTLAANVAFGVEPEARDRERILRALEAAQLSDLLATLPDGIDTWIGDRATRLSGGQRQRLGIARALYVDPQLIVLDEATSALDNLTERRISDAVEALHGSTTLVIVAHRLSTVRNCDQLIFLKDGVIEAQGTFEQVRAAHPEFARLVELGDLGALETGVV